MDAKSQSFDESLDRYARVLVEHALRKSGGSRSGAAQLLGVSRRRLYKLVRRLGVDLGQILRRRAQHG